MKHLNAVLLSLAAVVWLVVPALGGEFICDLPAGTDSFTESEGVGRIPFPGMPDPIPFAVCGPTVITRGDPVDEPPGGECTIPTEIVSMTLTGVFDPCGLIAGMSFPITITEDPADSSTGQIMSDPGGGLPGSSFFDVYTKVTIPGLGIIDMDYDVTLEEDTLDAVPPGSTTPGGPECIEPGEDVYDDSAPGVPPSHLHIPCPLKLCCRIFCLNTGIPVVLHLSPIACQFLEGQSFEGDCSILCDAQNPTDVRSWGSVKGIFR